MLKRRIRFLRFRMPPGEEENQPRGLAARMARSMFSLLIVVLLLCVAVGCALVLGYISTIFLPAWSDPFVEIVLVAFAFWFTGKLYDITFGDPSKR